MNKLKEYKELKAEIDNITKIVENQGETLKKIHNAIVGDKQNLWWYCSRNDSCNINN